MAIEHIGEGTFIDTERVDAPEGARQANIYVYAFFRSLEHVSYGLMLCDRTCADDEIDRQQVGQYGMEPLARYWQFDDAINEIESERSRRGEDPLWVFEEDSLVEVSTEQQYRKALTTLELDVGDWEGPGLYDFRVEPPTYSGTVEEYELESLHDAADQAFDFMFQGEEWHDAYRTLAEKD